jgi:creatinine amidohydrolase
MTVREFVEAVDRMPVFFVPTGILEWHGDHLPLGQDALKAYGLCLRIAEKLNGGIVLPANYWGRPGFSTYTGTLTFSENLVCSLFTEIFQQLEKVGAKIIVVITGHYGPCQVDCLKKTAERFLQSNPDISIIVQPEYEGVDVDGEVPADHAGKWETSIFWYLYPGLTQIDKFKMGKTQAASYPNPPENFYKENPVWDWKENLKITASRELGERTVEIISDHIVSLIKSKI